MSIKSELARLRERARAWRAAHEVQCTCELVIIEGEPTPEQLAVLARNATCEADHADKGFLVVEVPPMPEWMNSRDKRPTRKEVV